MDEPLPQESLTPPPAIQTTTHTVPWKIILPIGIVVAALLSGGGVYFWQQNAQNVAVKNVTAQLTALQNTQATQMSSTTAAHTAAQEEIKKLQAELLFEKVSVALFDKYRTTPSVFPDPKNSTVFYYVGKGVTAPDGDTYFIYQYDASKDEHYAATKEVNLTLIDTSKQLYAEKLGKAGLGIGGIESPEGYNMILRPLDLIANQLVFHYMEPDDSPGPCWSPWTERKLYAVDVTQNPPLKRTDFVVTEALKIQNQKEAEQCVREMEAGQL